MSLGTMSDTEFARLHDANGGSHHPAGCVYGGFSCGYWMTADGCDREHWERHVVNDSGSCPCGIDFLGASGVVFCEASGG